jgi:hypothetical protein
MSFAAYRLLDHVRLISLTPLLEINRNAQRWQYAQNCDDSQHNQNTSQSAFATRPSITTENVPALLVKSHRHKDNHICNHRAREQCAIRNPLLVGNLVAAQKNGNYYSRQYRPNKI